MNSRWRPPHPAQNEAFQFGTDNASTPSAANSGCLLRNKGRVVRGGPKKVKEDLPAVLTGQDVNPDAELRAAGSVRRGSPLTLSALAGGSVGTLRYEGTARNTLL